VRLHRDRDGAPRAAPRVSIEDVAGQRPERWRVDKSRAEMELMRHAARTTATEPV
jgi:hypothetical protein